MDRVGTYSDEEDWGRDRRKPCPIWRPCSLLQAVLNPVWTYGDVNLSRRRLMEGGGEQGGGGTGCETTGGTGT